MDAQQGDELYPIAVLIDELKVRLHHRQFFNIWLLTLLSSAAR